MPKCSKCRRRPASVGHNYCKQCKAASMRETRAAWADARSKMEKHVASCLTLVNKMPTSPKRSHLYEAFFKILRELGQ